jgi:hypothetical protein
MDIAEATFRYQIQYNASGGQQKTKAYFLSLFKKNPSPEFLKRFEGHKPPIKNGSEFEIGKGLKYHVYSMRRLEDTKVEVYGGYYVKGLCALGNTFVVENKGDKWIVTFGKILWKS